MYVGLHVGESVYALSGIKGLTGSAGSDAAFLTWEAFARSVSVRASSVGACLGLSVCRVCRFVGLPGTVSRCRLSGLGVLSCVGLSVGGRRGLVVRCRRTKRFQAVSHSVGLQLTVRITSSTLILLQLI